MKFSNKTLALRKQIMARVRNENPEIDFKRQTLIFGSNFNVDPNITNAKLIEWVLRTSDRSPSLLALKGSNSGAFFCTSEAYRSAVDIWLHARHFKPKLTLFDTMEILYSIQTKLYGQICSVIDRRVFKIKSHLLYEDEYASPWETIDDRRDTDEFGLTFRQWSTINKRTVE